MAAVLLYLIPLILAVWLAVALLSALTSLVALSAMFVLFKAISWPVIYAIETTRKAVAGTKRVTERLRNRRVQHRSMT